MAVGCWMTQINSNALRERENSYMNPNGTIVIIIIGVFVCTLLKMLVGLIDSFGKIKKYKLRFYRQIVLQKLLVPMILFFFPFIAKSSLEYYIA